MTEDPIRVGIIGRGFWATAAHIPTLTALPTFDLAAVAARDRSNAQHTADEFGIAHAYGDAQELISDPDLDLIAVLSPAPTHAHLARAAIEAGKDVYVEWPLTTSLEESESLLELAEARGIRHMVGLQRRTGPSIRYARDLVRDGYLGRVRSVSMSVGTADFGPARAAAAQWTTDPANYTTLLTIYGGHFLDAMFEIVGPPGDITTAVQHNSSDERTSGGLPATVVPADEVMAAGTFRDGGLFQVHLEGGQTAPTGLRIDITGTTGRLSITNSSTFAQDDNTIQGAHRDAPELTALPVPDSYRSISESLGGQTVRDLAYLYSAFAAHNGGTGIVVPTFADAINRHRDIAEIGRLAAR